MTKRNWILCSAILAVFAGVISISSLAAALYYGTSFFSDEVVLWPEAEFKSELWKEMPNEVRYVLVRDLIRRELLHDLTKDEVLDLLGRPDPGGTSPDMTTLQDNISYMIKAGTFKPSMIQLYLLRVLFDPETGKVSTYGIAKD